MEVTLILFACLASLLTFGSSEELQSVNVKEVASVPSLQRQPFVSPESDSSLDDYRRIKRQLPKPTAAKAALKEFQTFVLTCKGQCAAEMGIPPNEIEKVLLYEENPTEQEKCLMACMLQRANIMSEDNKVSVETIAHLAKLISENNELVIALAKAAANKCNSFVNPENKCEAGFQINRCIANSLKLHNVRLMY